MYVQPETMLYTVADLSDVWVLAQVFQSDAGKIKPGDPAEVTVDAYPGRVFSGRVDYILPQLDMNTRTLPVRLVFANPGLKLRPGMYVNVRAKLPMGRQLVVPSSAAFHSGTKNLLFVYSGEGNVEPREVELGPQVGDELVVTKGVKAQEQIVTSANFLIDSEAQLQAAAGAFFPPPPGAGQAASMNAPAEQQANVELTTDPDPPHKGGNIVRVKLTGQDSKPITGVLLLTLAGIWSMGHVPLDALPDISDVQVIIHTNWEGEPPNIIEDQVTYPIVTALLAAPRVKAVRAQTMFNDSSVFVIFEDGTDIYWARSRVVEYLQTIAGRLPENVHPAIGPDATGAGWVYEYALVDHTHKYSLADLRSLQDWHLRYQLETVPGVAEVAAIGGFVRQYQVRLDPNKLLAYGIPLSTVIDRVKTSTNEVGGRVLELSGTRYMIRGLGYLRSLADLENVPVMAKNGTPVLIKDLGNVSFGPDMREGVAEWQGEGETVGGIVVMRYGLNALNVINGIKKKLAEIKGSLPPGVEIVAGYDRAGLIEDSIHTLQRDLIEEAIIVSLVIVVFLFHFRSALIPILTLPIGVVASFIPMYYLHVSSNIMSLGGLALAIGVLVDAAIVMVENGYRHLSEHPSADSTNVPEHERRRILLDAAKQV